MKTKNFISIIPNVDKITELEALVKNDFEDFLRFNLPNSYGNFFNNDFSGKLSDLKKEFLQLDYSKEAFSENIIFLTDELTGPIVAERTFSGFENSRTVLLLLLDEFFKSELLQCLCERFELDLSELIRQAKPIYFKYWLLLWMHSRYPHLTKLLYKATDLAGFSHLSNIEPTQVIRYLPRFMLWNLGPILDSKRRAYIAMKLAEGQNIRKINGLKVSFSKKMAHHFTNAPKELTLRDAIWYGLVYGFNGNKNLFEVCRSSFGNQYRDLSFIRGILPFLSQFNLEEEELRQLIGYLRHCKQENDTFSIKGWTLNSLRRRALAYYDDLAQIRRGSYAYNVSAETTWLGASYKPWEEEEDGNSLKIIQITTYKGLLQEGQTLQHCVGSYVGKCLSGEVSIWSLRLNGHPVVTIEITEKGKIIQAQSRLNSTPKQKYKEIIREWAKRENLT